MKRRKGPKNFEGESVNKRANNLLRDDGLTVHVVHGFVQCMRCKKVILVNQELIDSGKGVVCDGCGE